MEPDTSDPTSTASTRAFLVARLKRAASLPRMQNGRRPPMHPEGPTDSERLQTEEHQRKEEQEGPKDAELNDPEDVRDDNKDSVGSITADKVELKDDGQGTPQPSPKADLVSKGDSTPQSADDKSEQASESTTRTVTPDLSSSTSRKRRSRSRSRSRNSRDLRGKARATPTPTLVSPAPGGGDSSAEESSQPLSSPEVLPLLSPVPSHLHQLQTSRLLLSPTPDPSLFHPGTSPSTPLLPSLEALQKGLFRSNSASARLMALQKLTGSTDVSEQSFSSPSPTPPPFARLGRNHTVSGGERNAARQLMLKRLAERTRDTDGDLTSGDEKPFAILPFYPPTPSPVPQPVVSLDDPLPEKHSVAASGTPSPTPDAPQETSRRSTISTVNSDNSVEYKRLRRRSVVIEEDDMQPQSLPDPPLRRSSQANSPRDMRASEAVSYGSSSDFASAMGVPLFLSARQSTPPRQDTFPTSPFTSPLKERSPDEEEEKVLYHAESRFLDAFNHPISWIAEPVPERMPLNEDTEEAAERRAFPEASSRGFASQYEEPSHGSSRANLVIETEVSPEVTHVPPSPASAVAFSSTASPTIRGSSSDDPGATATAAAGAVAAVTSLMAFPTRRLSAVSRIASDRSPLTTEFGGFTADGEDVRSSNVVESPTKRTADSSGSTTSTWEKVKSTFTGGRRSRTNSILTRDKRDHTESSVRRESAASITSSAKTDKGDSSYFAAQQQPQQPQSPQQQQQQQQQREQCHTPVMQAPSASASMLSLAPHTAPRGGVSPVPPASSVDLLKYHDAKLFPFPGMRMLEEQRNRSRAALMSPSASSPDIILSPQGLDVDQHANISSSSNNTTTTAGVGTTSRHLEGGRARKLSHQASDTRLLAKYNSPPSLSAFPSMSSHAGDQHTAAAAPAIIASSPASGSPPPSSGIQGTLAKLPMNRDGVKKWLIAKKLFSSQNAPPAHTSQPSPATNAARKASLSDLLKGRKDELVTDWEDVASDKPRAPLNSAVPVTYVQSVQEQLSVPEVLETPLMAPPQEQNLPAREHPDNEKTPKVEVTLHALESDEATPEIYYDPDAPGVLSSPPEPSSTTPDPMSSAEGYSARSTSESSSATSSQYSARQSAQGAVVLERLDEMLGRGSRSPMWASAVDDPPRKLSLSSPVLQVVNANTVKDRFLFLFSDILVIAKPIMHEQDNLLDASMKPSPLDRKFIVKNVVLLRNLRFSADREDDAVKSLSGVCGARNPVVRNFVHQFVKDPDLAISTLLNRRGNRDNPVALGQFLFRTCDLDRARLGDYLSRRSSKLVLKAYIDSFGFTGLRVDKCLRAFLHSIYIPLRTGANQLEYLLDAFAVRWYEANARMVAYDKDVAVRLVRSIVHLNEVMHGGIASEPGSSGYPRRNVTSRQFMDAFRRHETRGLVTDDLLDNLYNSIRREPLSQARNPSSSGPPDIHIAIKRALPPRLTYKIQSEPIILRIPQPDPRFMIYLYGQDLVFEPPTLSFAKSSEASFRVTGMSLGAKTMIMSRSGPNALAYSGLPQNNTVIIERAFMRNTFQIAFANQHTVKRRYMFSVDDPLIRHQWTVSLRRQIDSARSAAAVAALGSLGAGQSRFHRAAENTAFRVLQDVLLGPQSSTVNTLFPNGTGGANRVSSPSFHSPNSSLSRLGARGVTAAISSTVDGAALKGVVTRSKSRSKVYHRHGPGKLERELNLSGDDESRDSRDLDDDLDGDGFRGGGSGAAATYDRGRAAGARYWSGRDLEMQCQQNSSIALVLAFLQVGAPDHHDRIGG